MDEKFSDIVKALTRPFLTWTGLFAWIVMIIVDAPYPEEFQYVVIGMLCWWFGERLIRKIKVS